jgi:chemosensory pili system protein ChpA (sensor histidine kinase/response regulator)
MRPEGTVEYNSLSWVKKQLDAVLTDAQTSLSEYIENNDDAASLEQCIDHLRLVFGTLQMVEIYGAAMLAEEMELTAQAQLDGKVEKPEDAYDVLMRAMLQLPDYLEGLQSGNKDTPIVLMPLINDMRAARNEKLLSENVLFVPDVDSAEIESVDLDVEAIESGKLTDEAKRLRTHYQIGLLDVLRNNKELAGLKRMMAVISSLEKVSAEASVRRFWTVITSLLEGLIDEGIDKSISTKMLLGGIDRQIKLLIDVGEDNFVGEFSQEVLKNILYYVGHSTSDGERVSKVKAAYKLDELLPGESDVSGIDASMGGFNAELFDTVSQGIREDLATVKDVLEIFMHSGDKDTKQIEPLTEQLEKIADTYGMLGLGAARQRVIDQRDEINNIISGELEASEHKVMDIAGELLGAEAELDNYIAEKSGLIDSDIGVEDRVVPASEYRKVLNAVVEQGLDNFTEAKDAILSYAAGIGDKEQLDVILQRLEEVRGATMMLPMDRIEKLLESLMSYVRIALQDHHRKPEAEEQDTLADVVTSIEYYLEAVSEGRPGVDIGLQAGEDAVQKLLEINKQYEGQEPEVTSEPEEKHIDAEEVSVSEDASDAVVVLDVAEEAEPVTTETEAAPTAAAPAAGQHEEYEILGEDADEEIVEIFIEEAVEVLEALHEHLPKWRSNIDDEESLTVVRRSFHTLKGSGRLIGAMLIGEFAWKFESMLNRVIEKKIQPDETMFELLDEAMAVLPQLIEQLKGNREPIPNIYQLMSAAEAISEGKTPEAPVIEDEVDSVGIVDTEAELEVQVDVEEDEAKSTDEEITLEVVSEPTDEEMVLEVSEDQAGEDEIALDVEGDAGDELDLTSLEVTEEPTDEMPEEEAEEEITLEVVSEPTDEEMVLEVSEDQADEDEITLDVEVDAGDELDLTSLEVTEESTDEMLEEEVSIDISALDIDESPDISVTENLVEDELEAIDEESIEVEVPMESSGEIEEEQIQLISNDEQESAENLEEETIKTADEELVVEIDELEEADESEGLSKLDMDPMLFQIYYDESQGHLQTIKAMLAQHESGEQKLEVNKDLIRAFHTLFGSARTAEIEPIAEISGAAEKYVKAREEAEDLSIPEEVVTLIAEVTQSVESMLEYIKTDGMPESNKDLLEQINKIVQDELQEQLQKSSSPDVVQLDEVEAAPEVVSEDEEEPEYSYGDVDDDLIDIFLEEAEELLEDCENSIRKLEEDVDDASSVHELQRHMHTLKGGARMASLTPVGDITHVLESMVISVSEQKIEANKAFFDVLHEALDRLNAMLANVKQRQPLRSANRLVNNIESIIKGEVPEKRAVERFDVDMQTLEADEDEVVTLEAETPEGITERRSDAGTSTGAKGTPKRRASDLEEEKPHWGERATDVNFKETQEQVRVRADLLNNLVNYAGEVNIHHARMNKQITDIGFNLKELDQTVIRLKEQLRKLEIETEIQIRSSYEKEADEFDEDFDPLEMDKYSTLQQLTRSLAETASDVESIKNFVYEIVTDSETLLMQESRISTDLQEGLMRTRMVRFGGMSTRLRRIVRQTARELGKEVNVEILGEDNEVDRTVLDRMVAPLEHMLRNAVAHGIESPEKRIAAGKSESGRINITVGRQGPDVVVTVADDGGGIDASIIRKKAIKQGLLEEDSPLTDHDVLQFILKSGFSTADTVTQVAGRGVGMDVVDSEIKQLGGVLEIDTEKGKGTTFKVRLPLTLAINQALMVSAGDDIFAIPLASIEGVVRITGPELQSFYDSDDLHYEFNAVNYELKHLGRLLSGNQPSYADQHQLFPVLLANVGDQHFALHVDDLLGRREIVVKPVGLQIGTVRGVAGATILADGRVVLILEMSALVVGESLFKEIVSEEEVEVVKESTEPTIMVVDDSITIRKVTARILERNGMKVMAATDGVDATNQLLEEVPDLMLLDIEMPRMDGFELATYMRNDSRLKDVPIIMITSRTGAKHKERAKEIGVEQYLGKPYQEEELMKNINALLEVNS